MSGDLDSITKFSHNGQSKSYGVVTNWFIPLNSIYFRVGSTGLSGLLPEIRGSSSPLNYQAPYCHFTGSKMVIFRTGMTLLNISNQNTVFPTAEIDKLLKSAADWFEDNAPTADCSYLMNGINNGVPTGGTSNVDLLRLMQYYSNAGKTATIAISS
jgi:hypothetical protein